jgi:hypothetical protein
MVDSPKAEPNTDDRHLELQQHLDPILADLIDQFAQAGYTTPEVIDGMRDVLWNRRMAYEQDPDPAEDTTIPEPANDWPAAD